MTINLITKIKTLTEKLFGNVKSLAFSPLLLFRLSYLPDHRSHFLLIRRAEDKSPRSLPCLLDQEPDEHHHQIYSRHLGDSNYKAIRNIQRVQENKKNVNMSIPGTSVEVKRFYFENKKQQQQQIIIEGCFCQFLSDDYCIEV